MAKDELKSLCAVEPLSVEHANAIRDEINQHIIRIDGQLKEPNREYADGSRMENTDYWEWRKRALASQAFARQRMGQLRRWINQKNGEDNEARMGLEKRKVEALEQIADALDKISLIVRATEPKGDPK